MANFGGTNGKAHGVEPSASGVDDTMVVPFLFSLMCFKSLCGIRATSLGRKPRKRRTRILSAPFVYAE